MKKIALAIFLLGGLLCWNVAEQNKVVALKIAIPILTKEVNRAQEKNLALQYHIDRFESPENLLALASRKEHAHLQQPLMDQVLFLAQGEPLIQERESLQEESLPWHQFVAALLASFSTS